MSFTGSESDSVAVPCDDQACCEGSASLAKAATTYAPQADVTPRDAQDVASGMLLLPASATWTQYGGWTITFTRDGKL